MTIKSSFCGNNSCVEVDLDEVEPGVIYVYDTHGNRCVYDRDEWRAFIQGAILGEFDLK